ncbi:Metallo-dependent hydrolase [Ramaria rubella]|nr:Metallo-dependent hydrolase [Ramaria rubella]
MPQMPPHCLHTPGTCVNLAQGDLNGEEEEEEEELAALSILSKTPVIVRSRFRNNLTVVDLHDKMPGHIDIPRLRKGKVQGFFWSVYVSCQPNGPDFMILTNCVRDTLEKIDVARTMIDQYRDVFQLVTNTTNLHNAVTSGKIAGMLTVEGGHQLGSSLGVLRAYYTLGVRYVTLMHSCNNAFANSSGILMPIESKHWGPPGRTLMHEMNCLGMLVDLLHIADMTVAQALALTEAPVMWSHLSAQAVWNVPRNIPDFILKCIGLEKGQKDGVIMINFSPQFVAVDGNAMVQAVADHIEHIGNTIILTCFFPCSIGIGSNYDRMGSTPEGLEDTSKYPELFAELRTRGWSKMDLAGLAEGEILCIWRGVEDVSIRMQHEGVQPAYNVYEKRQDL